LDIRGIIFDFDGTLGNTLPICFSAFRIVLKEFLGRDFTDSEIENYFGPDEEGIFRQLVPDRWQECLQAYLYHYEQFHHKFDAGFTGIDETLDLLQTRQVPIAIVTGKGSRSLSISLKYLGLETIFNPIESGSPNGAEKPKSIQKIIQTWQIAPEYGAYLGDAPSDVHSARLAGVIPLAAAWSPTSNYQSLISAEPSRIFPSVQTFINWIETGFH
jgi:phosphoglycolate phosphatase-like HAD superfamily hydrolase